MANIPQMSLFDYREIEMDSVKLLLDFKKTPLMIKSKSISFYCSISSIY